MPHDRATVRAVFGAIEATGSQVVTNDKMRQLGTAVAMLNSMVLSGESHSETSRQVVRAAFASDATHEKAPTR